MNKQSSGKSVRVRSLLFILFGFWIALEAHAYYNDVSDYEISLLPHYLQVKVKSFLGIKNQEIIRETTRYGKELGKAVYSPLHHYGLGLIYLSRVQGRANYPKRAFDMDSAIKEFTFVIEHSPRNSFVLYDVYCKRGETYLLKDQITFAVKDFLESIALKPDSFGTYFKLSECYKKIGDTKNAEAVLQIGRERAAKIKTEK